MDRYRGIFVGSFLALSVGVVAYNWIFLSPPPSSGGGIAVLNGQSVKSDALPFIRVRQLLEEQHRIAHQEILQQESSIRKQYESLKKEGKGSTADKQKKKIKLDKQVSELQQEVRKKQEKLIKQFSALTTKLEEELHSIIREIVREKNISMVLNTIILDTQSVLYSDQASDITKEVIKRINKKLPNVKLPGDD